MTIKTRNRLSLLLLVSSVTILVLSTFMMLYTVNSGTFTHPDGTVFLLHVKSTPQTFTSAVCSLFIFIIYVCLAAVFIYFEFEKTQSSEIFYFSIFLLGCLTESIRLLFPMANLWHVFSTFSLFCGRIIVFGRTLAPLALLFTTIAVDSEQWQNINRNTVILFIVSIIIAAIMPLDTAAVSPACLIPWSQDASFSVVRLLVLLAAALTLALSTHTADKKDISYFAFIMLEAGYFLCCAVFNFAILVIGSALLFAGTVLYLQYLHHQYLWQ